MLISVIGLGVVGGFVIGTFGEYWIHRGMHRGVILAELHAGHHRDGTAQGVFGEARGYSLGARYGALIFLPIDYFFLTGGAFGGGVICGAALHALFAGWSHQAQHEDPRLVWWMSKTPVHFVHHELGQVQANFGISVDWWDRVFGTYKPELDWRALLDPNLPKKAWWQVSWYDRHDPPRSAADARKHIDQQRQRLSVASS
jgi:sterol desaturase/sphingolipid hydroxylase (fatty acid hydroxylase superfamily)